MTRTEAAAEIAKAAEADGYATVVWAPDGDAGPVRVYVSIPAASWKKKARRIGHVAVAADGTVESQLIKQSGRIMALISAIDIDPAVPKERAAGEAPKAAAEGDDDVAAFEASERATSRAEGDREQG